jgi:uncharacterized membrane protein (UPF0182 family)
MTPVKITRDKVKHRAQVPRASWEDVLMRIRGLPGLLVLAALLLFVLPSAIRFYTDWLWFRELGYEGVFLRTLNAQTIVFAVTFSIVYLFLYFNLRFARRRTLDRPRVVLGAGADGRPITLEGRQIAGLATPIALGVALLLGLAGATSWYRWLRFFNGASFGTADPLLGLDVSFYVFRLPIYQMVRQQALLVAGIALIGSGIYYLLSGSFVIEARPHVSSWPRIRLVPAARRHLSLLAALIFVLLAWGSWLEVPNTLLTPTPASVAFGASYSDVWARIPLLWITIGILAIGAVLSVWQGFGQRGWPLPLAIVLYLAVSAAGGIYAGFVQRVVVTPNEQDKEQPYILHNIAATRAAYALDRVEERAISGDAELTAQDIIDNAATIENVRLWDHAPLLRTFSQIQTIRTYYSFQSIDNDRYDINGSYRQVMLSARELNTESMNNRSWVNERLMFTHGFGVALGPVNQVTTQGLPVLFIRDIPPVSTVDLQLTQPSIYYGELSNEYVLVKTRQPEFHYPKDADFKAADLNRAEQNETTFYSGRGGVPVGNFLRRLLFAIRFASTDILFTNVLTPESRVMFHRQIGERVRLLAPFLTYDNDPYPVVSDGRLFWLQDAYTTTPNYPYATPIAMSRQTGEINYIRNSVKIVIDAYHGSVTFYVAEPGDPIVQTVDRVFPGLLKPLSEMPAGLRAHVRYPEDIFKVQSQMYTLYHMTNPQVFYNKEDQWEVPAMDSGQNSVRMQPYYTVMRLPGESRTEFIQMLPFTPRARDNLAAWMVARSDGEHYGRLFVFQFPKQSLVFGPRQINGRINQDQTIAPQITLWNQQGSQVIHGTLLVIPIKESLIYVRPLYLQSTTGNIPELKRVIVAYKDSIVMAETLTGALGQLFGRAITASLAPDQLPGTATSVVEAPPDLDLPAGPAEPAPVEATETHAALAARAKEHRDNMDRALREGDWALFGEEMAKLFDVIERMQQVK